MKKNNTKIQHPKSNFALTLVSRIFDPFLVLAATTVRMVTKSTLNGDQQAMFIAIMFFVMICPPALLLFWAVRTKRIKNWDVSDRSQRPEAFIIMFLLGFVNIIIVQWFGDTSLVRLFITYQLWIAILMSVSFFWKISVHSAVMALATGILVKSNGIHWWPVLLLVPVISIVRVMRKDHTPAQVFAGAVCTWILVYFSS